MSIVYLFSDKMAGTDIFGKLKQFDAYPKTLEDFRVKTFGGAASEYHSLLCIALNALYFSSYSVECIHHSHLVPL